MENPFSLKQKAQLEAYLFFDQHVRPLPKLKDGTVNSVALGLQDNDVDAFRHAYVSGVFAQEYGDQVADLFGRMNEFFSPDIYSNSRSPGSLNMDLWNNQVGRNELYFDFQNKLMMNRLKFVALIREGRYPEYHVRKFGNRLVPVSNADKSRHNNLG